MDAMVVQTGIAGPILLALMLRIARAGEPGPVQRQLFWLLAMIVSWIVGLTLEYSSGVPQRWIAPFVLVPTCFMAPAFLVILLHLARIERFVDRRGAAQLVMAPFWFFLAAFLTHDWHGWMASPTVRLADQAEVGPLFWVFQFWSNGAALAAIGLCIHTGLTSPSRAERRQVGLLCVGGLVPLAAHLVHVLGLLPLSYPLTPLALCVTAVTLVAAIGRFRLLEMQPIARRDVLESSADGVLMADVDMAVVDLNPAAAALLNTSVDAAHGASLEVLLAGLGPLDPPEALPELVSALRAGAPAGPVEVRTEDGRVLELSGGTPLAPSGVRAGSFVALRDRSNERRAERMLLQSQKLESVGILAAGVAHEVNNPLSFVRANLAHLQEVAAELDTVTADLPKSLAEDLDGVPEVLEDCVAGVERIQSIVQGLLRLSRPPREGRVLCDVNDAVREAARFVALDRARAVPVELELGDGLPGVLASSDQLVQVVLNLMINARRALVGIEAPLVRVATRAVEDRVEIRVIDNGPGVPEAIRDKIFDLFFTTGGPDEGTGLGLAIAFDLVREHDGMLELEFVPGGGACFVVRLPAVPVD